MTTYHIISAIDYLSGDEAVYRTLEGQTLPAQYHDAGPVCEHCNQSRNRKTVYVLLADDGQYRQVGSTCLRDFTGQDESVLVSSFREKLEADEDERIRQSRMIGIEFFLSRVSQEIREHGWLGATAAREQGKSGTAFYAAQSCADGLAPDAADLAIACAAIDWAQSLSEDEPSDYLHNLHVLAIQTAIEPKHINLCGSMIVAHQRALARAAELAEKRQSRHFGTVGKRETFTLTVERVNSIESQYGVTHIHTMRDAAGNVAVWFATREKLENRTYQLLATVKSHGVRDGIAQTVVTRCAVK